MMVMILLVILELTHVLLGLSTLPTQILVHCLLLAAQDPRIMSHGLKTTISLKQFLKSWDFTSFFYLFPIVMLLHRLLHP